MLTERPPICPHCGARHVGPHPWCAVLAQHRAMVAAGLVPLLNGHRKIHDGKETTEQPEGSEIER